ncbi:hypothetical protein ACROYT_G018872 [Oculina patagonica]
MCSRRFLPTLGLSVALCCLVVGGYYQYMRATVDGGYTEWSKWSNCTKECGEGIQTRYRRCEQPIPGRYGKDCYRFGPEHDQKPCFLKICPVDGKFGDWSSFSACNKPCGGGIRARTRQCNNPPAVFGGKPCEGPSREEQPCNTHVCPVDGGYTQWSEFSPCSVSCGKGTKTRTRSCTNPPPSNGGKPCAAPASENAECNLGDCKSPEPPAKQNESPAQNTPDEQQAAAAQNPEQVAQNPADQPAQNAEGQEVKQPQEQKPQQ